MACSGVLLLDYGSDVDNMLPGTLPESSVDPGVLKGTCNTALALLHVCRRSSVAPVGCEGGTCFCGQGHWLDIDVNQHVVSAAGPSEGNDNAQAVDFPYAKLLGQLQ